LPKTPFLPDEPAETTLNPFPEARIDFTSKFASFVFSSQEISKKQMLLSFRIVKRFSIFSVWGAK
jgi:hypothetical protein